MSQKIVQYVGFQTDLSATAFRAIWTPVALAFKIRGIAAIDLYQFAAESSPPQNLAFVSRNVWQLEQYLRVFPSGIADEAAFGAVSVVQFGGYAGETTKDADAIENLSLSFVNSKPSDAAHVFERVTDVVPYQFVIENANSTAASIQTPAQIQWTGKHLVRL